MGDFDYARHIHGLIRIERITPSPKRSRVISFDTARGPSSYARYVVEVINTSNGRCIHHDDGIGTFDQAITACRELVTAYRMGWMYGIRPRDYRRRE